MLSSSYQVEDVTSSYITNQRRFSQVLANVSANNIQSNTAGYKDIGESGVGTELDTIRINLPEILDQQDEVTILRLLIKLLANKVSKLSDEKKRLLHSVTVLNDINAEMAAIIERGIQK